MIDISTELAIIASNKYGDNVRTAIGTAMGKLNEVYQADIAEEVVSLATTTKGIEMKEAIIDALSKMYASSPSGGGGALPAATSYLSTMVVNNTKIEPAQDFPPRLSFVNGVWYNSVSGSVNTIAYDDNAETRLAVRKFCTLPVGKTLTINCLTEDRMCYGLFVHSNMSSPNITSGWLDFPFVYTNEGTDDLICFIDAKKSDNSAITPSELGTVTAQID